MKHFIAFSLCALAAAGLEAVELPLTEVTIFSSGVAYFEHEVKVSGSCNFTLSFEEAQLNDFLKSLAISDAGAKKITLDYSSSDTVEKTLASLPIDLSNRPSMSELLKNQIGSELNFSVLQGVEKFSAAGRLLSVDKVFTAEKNSSAGTMLSVLTDEGIKVFNLENVLSFNFKDTEKNKSLTKALEVLDAESTSNRKKKISINITGVGDRTVKISYVLGAPVWKTSYRLILGNETAVFQAWAIVDNSTDLDWNGVKLNLISGKPVSFRQNLYEPYFVNRPMLPLPIEGAAELEMYDSAAAESDIAMNEMMEAPAYRSMKLMQRGYNSAEAKALDEEVFSGNATVLADSKFVFTPKDPVTLARQKSMMLPLKVTTLPAKKMTVFSNLGAEAKHPKLCVELTNTSGINLPAGAMTLYDEGYSGDSMIAFLPKDAKRLISYGDDLLLSGRRVFDTEETIRAVTAKDGVLKVEVERAYTSKYNFVNADSKSRSVILEHPITQNTELDANAKPFEKTQSAYRFEVACSANQTSVFTVNERQVILSKYSLINDPLNANVANYISSGKAPSNVVSTFKRIAEERAKVEAISRTLNDLQSKVKNLNSEQERTRKNMSALAQTSEVANFTKKLLDLETQIVAANAEIEKTHSELDKARKAFNEFLNSVEF